MRGAKFKSDVQSKFFYTVLSAWNVLSRRLVEVDTLMVRKRPLDRHMDMSGLEGYVVCAGK